MLEALAPDPPVRAPASNADGRLEGGRWSLFPVLLEALQVLFRAHPSSGTARAALYAPEPGSSWNQMSGICGSGLGSGNGAHGLPNGGWSVHARER